VSARVDIREIRAGCEQFGEDEARFWCPDILALVEAVEAAHAHVVARRDRLPTKWPRLLETLSQFDFGDDA
jgi:hypothetical protein